MGTERPNDFVIFITNSLNGFIASYRSASSGSIFSRSILAYIASYWPAICWFAGRNPFCVRGHNSSGGLSHGKWFLRLSTINFGGSFSNASNISLILSVSTWGDSVCIVPSNALGVGLNLCAATYIPGTQPQT